MSLTIDMKAALLLVLTISTGEACSRHNGNVLTLAGSTSVQPFVEKWADAYRAGHPDLSIQVQGGGSTAGVQAAESGAAQIGMSSRPLTSEEATRLDRVLIARDGIAIVVHPRNPVASLRLDDVRAIYAGEARSWSRFGGRGPITLITREEGSGTRAAFESLVMAQRRIAVFALVQDSTGAVRQMVASDPAAIGYVSLGLVDATIKAVKLDGIEASEATIDAGAYPLVRPFLFLVKPETRPNLAVAGFIAWILGPDGRRLTRQEGLVPPPS
jgi:phosphate transport system substrate-binding protein